MLSKRENRVCVGCRCLARDGRWTESAQRRVNGDTETKRDQRYISRYGYALSARYVKRMCLSLVAGGRFLLASRRAIVAYAPGGRSNCSVTLLSSS